MVMNFYDQIAENKKMTYFLFGAFFFVNWNTCFFILLLIGWV